MKLFKHTLIAISLFTISMANDAAAIMLVDGQGQGRIVEQDIEIIAGNDNEATVVVSINGDTSTLIIPKDSLSNAAALSEALVDLPSELKETLIQQLSTLSLGGEEENKRVFIYEFEEERLSGDEQTERKERVHRVKHRQFIADGKSNVKADVILKLLHQSELNQEDLDKIQAALDHKR